MNIEEVRKYGNLTFLAKKAVEGFITGLHKSPYKGFSVEFAEHKPYNFGESTKNIDWKLYSKTDKLYSKQYEEETNLRAYIVLDTSGSMYYPADTNGKITYSCFAGAALAHLLQKQRDAVGLYSFADKLYELTAAKSSNTHMQQLFSTFEKIPKAEPNSTQTDLIGALHLLSEKVHKRSLIVIFSDMFDHRENEEALFNALLHLKYNKHEVIVFHVLDHETELNFEFENRPYQFIDAETKAKIKVNPKELKKTILSASKERKAAIKKRCGMAKIDYVDIDINQSLDQVFLAYLLKRSKLY